MAGRELILTKYLLRECLARKSHQTCQGVDASFLVQRRCLSLNLVFVLPVLALDGINSGFQFLNRNGRFYLHR